MGSTRWNKLTWSRNTIRRESKQSNWWITAQCWAETRPSPEVCPFAAFVRIVPLVPETVCRHRNSPPEVELRLGDRTPEYDPGSRSTVAEREGISLSYTMSFACNQIEFKRSEWVERRKYTQCQSHVCDEWYRQRKTKCERYRTLIIFKKAVGLLLLKTFLFASKIFQFVQFDL